MSFAVGAQLLCTFAPILKNWLSGDDDPIAEKAVSIAQAVTDTSNIRDAVAALTGNPTLSSAFNEQIQANKNHFELLLADRASARQNYANSQKQADRMAERIMRQNLPLSLLVVVIQGCVTYFLRDYPTLLSTATAACTWVTKHLLDERKEVTGFYFGGALSRDTPKKPT